MKKFVFFIIFLLITHSGKAQFTRMPLNYTHDGTFYSPNIMSIVDQNHVWIASERQNPSNFSLMTYSKALTTTDGGNTWHFFQIPVTGSPILEDVEAYSDSICYYLVADLNTGH